MSYQRKTRDEWEVQQWTWVGWECVYTGESFRDARDRAKEYRVNQPELPVRIKRVRVKIEVSA